MTWKSASPINKQPVQRLHQQQQSQRQRPTARQHQRMCQMQWTPVRHSQMLTHLTFLQMCEHAQH